MELDREVYPDLEKYLLWEPFFADMIECKCNHHMMQKMSLCLQRLPWMCHITNRFLCLPLYLTFVQMYPLYEDIILLLNKWFN